VLTTGPGDADERPGDPRDPLGRRRGARLPGRPYAADPTMETIRVIAGPVQPDVTW
jgi:hypothetical protein